MNALVLFDIDKTLLTSAKYPTTHRNAFSFAIKQVYGIDTQIDFIKHAGMTDQQIAIALLRLAKVPDEQIKTGMSRCMGLMSEYYKRNIRREELEILPGVRELLEKLQEEGATLGLVTGNVEAIAWEKLEKAGLKEFFKFGGFGSDNPSRTELVKIAIRKAEKLGFRKGDQVFLFGDTVRDVAAGKGNHVKVVGVATGDCTAEELQAAGADLVVESLKNTDKLTSFLRKNTQ